MRPPLRRGEVISRALVGGVGVALGVLASCAPIAGWPTTSCTRDSDCGLETLRCNDSGQCEERCTPPELFCGVDRCARCCEDSHCDPGERCDQGSGTCQSVCNNGRRFCPSTDGGAGTCQQCCSDAHCGNAPGSGLLCVQGTCQCGAGQRQCGEICVDLHTCCPVPQPNCEEGFICDGGLCCDYSSSGDGGLGAGGCYSP